MPLAQHTGLNPACTLRPPPTPPHACPAVFTGAFWVILRVLFSLMWIGILLSPLIM